MMHAVLASHEHMRIMLRPLRMGGIQILDAPDLFALFESRSRFGLDRICLELRSKSR